MPSRIHRQDILAQLQVSLERSPVTALLGPRQCGKTTLARQLVPIDSANYFDLEDPVSLSRLAEPMNALRALQGLVVIDEIQRMPELFPVLRVLADREPALARFLILGSASPRLVRNASESLAGRVETVEIGGFSAIETGFDAQDKLWLRGGFPRSYLARSDADSFAWRKNFVQAVVERDLPMLGAGSASAALMRFWTMLAHVHAQVWNAADPARSLGISESTVRRYLDLLTGVYMVRQLQPWHANLAKRQVKSPKIFFRDCGLLHFLLGIRTQQDLVRHPKSGASWEGFVVEETLRTVQADEAYFWATHAGAELDLLLIKNGRRVGVEIKRADVPSLTPSMRIALEDLRLERLVVVYPGAQRYSLAANVHAMPFPMFLQQASRMFEAS